jgi:hypothetical protein
MSVITKHQSLDKISTVYLHNDVCINSPDYNNKISIKHIAIISNVRARISLEECTAMVPSETLFNGTIYWRE